LKPILTRHGVGVSEEMILEAYGEQESRIQKGPYLTYRLVLRRIIEGLGQAWHFVPGESELRSLEDSLPEWPPFADTVRSLQRLKRKNKLAILSNIDDDLFSGTARLLGVMFDQVLTAQQLGSYKPSLNNFQALIERLGVPKERILHVAQSPYHDIEPARKAGLATVWVNRRRGRNTFGATPAARAEPDLEVPDLQSLVSAAGLVEEGE